MRDDCARPLRIEIQNTGDVLFSTGVQRPCHRESLERRRARASCPGTAVAPPVFSSASLLSASRSQASSIPGSVSRLTMSRSRRCERSEGASFRTSASRASRSELTLISAQDCDSVACHKTRALVGYLIRIHFLDLVAFRLHVSTEGLAGDAADRKESEELGACSCLWPWMRHVAGAVGVSARRLSARGTRLPELRRGLRLRLRTRCGRGRGCRGRPAADRPLTHRHRDARGPRRVARGSPRALEQRVRLPSRTSLEGPDRRRAPRPECSSPDETAPASCTKPISRSTCIERQQTLPGPAWKERNACEGAGRAIRTTTATAGSVFLRSLPCPGIRTRR